MKKIGILGGMGPAASSSLYARIISYCQKKYNSVQDNEYPQVMLYSIALDGFDETGIVDAQLVLKQLLQGIKMLEMSQCDFIVIPCNTVHVFIEQLRMYAQVPILSIIEEVVQRVKDGGNHEVLLIGSQTTLSLGIYQQELENKSIQVVQPNPKKYEDITALIMDVMGGKISLYNIKKVVDLIHSTKTQAVILGCTELPLVISQQDLNIPLFDSLHILAEAAVDYAMGENIAPRSTPRQKIS